MILNQNHINQMSRSQSRTRNRQDLARSTGSNSKDRPKSSFGCQRTKVLDKESDSEQAQADHSEGMNLLTEYTQHKSTNDSNSCRVQNLKPPFHPGRAQTVRLQSAGLSASNNIMTPREKDNVQRYSSNKVKGLNLKGLHLYEDERNNELNSSNRYIDSARLSKRAQAKLRKCQTFCFRRFDELIPVQSFLRKKLTIDPKLSFRETNAQLRQTLHSNFLIPETNRIYELVTHLYEQHQKLVKLYLNKQSEDQETEHSPTPQPLKNNEFFQNPMFSTIDFNMSNPSSNVSFAGLEQQQQQYTSRPKNPEARMDQIISLLTILSEENELLIQNMEIKELWTEGQPPVKSRFQIREEDSDRIAHLSEKTETVIGQNNWIVKRLDEIEFQIGVIQQKQDIMTPLPNLHEYEQEDEEMVIVTPNNQIKDEENGNYDEMYYTCIMEDEIEDQKLLNATLKEKINLIESSAEKKIEILEFDIQKLNFENEELKDELKRREEEYFSDLQKKDSRIAKLEDELKKVRKLSNTFSDDDQHEEQRVDSMKKQIEKDIFEFSQKMAQKQREIATIEEKLSFSNIQRKKPQGLRKPTRFKSTVPFETQTQTTGCTDIDVCKFEVESGRLSRKFQGNFLQNIAES